MCILVYLLYYLNYILISFSYIYDHSSDIIVINILCYIIDIHLLVLNQFILYI